MAQIVSKNFCSSQELHFFHTTHVWGSDKITDASGNVVFKVRHPSFSSTDILLTDPNDLPILHISHKHFTLRDTWTARIGKGSPRLFTLKQSSAFQMSMSLHVFMGPNPDTDSSAPDYKVKRDHSRGSAKIYSGSSGQVIAKMKPEHGSGGDEITIAPGVDYAFAVALFLIVKQRDSHSNTHHMDHGAAHATHHMDHGAAHATHHMDHGAAHATHHTTTHMH